MSLTASVAQGPMKSGIQVNFNSLSNSLRKNKERITNFEAPWCCKSTAKSSNLALVSSLSLDSMHRIVFGENKYSCCLRALLEATQLLTLFPKCLNCFGQVTLGNERNGAEIRGRRRVVKTCSVDRRVAGRR